MGIISQARLDFLRTFALLFVALVALSCSKSKENKSDMEVGGVSIYRMIASPEIYEDKRIIVYGYSSEGRLFPSEKSELMKDFSSSLFLEGEELREAAGTIKQCNKKYVFVVGDGCVDELGFGCIKNIESIHSIFDKSNCYLRIKVKTVQTADQDDLNRTSRMSAYVVKGAGLRSME